MAGTMLGKVWMYDFKESHLETMTEFSDEGVRGLYMNEESCYASLSESCRTWKRANFAQDRTMCFRSLDKKNTTSVKHVMQRGGIACILFPTSTTVACVNKQDQHQHRAFEWYKLGSTTEVWPCDFDGENLCLVDRRQSATLPAFWVVQLERNEQLQLENLPKASHASLIKLFGQNCLAYAVGSAIYVYDYRRHELRHVLQDHSAEVLAMDASEGDIIATLGADSVVNIWDGSTGECRGSLYVPEATFFLGYPYFISLRGQRVVVSADEGLYLIEFDHPQLEVANNSGAQHTAGIEPQVLE